MPGRMSGSVAVSSIPALGELPDKGIEKIFRDSDGYMWYVTSNGLCRDDGYRPVILSPPNKSHNISDLAEDRKGRLLLSTDNGAWILDRSGFRFLAIDEERLGGRQVRGMYVTSDGDIWVNQRGFLHRYDSELQWKKSYEVRDRSGEDTYVSGFCQSRKGDIYMTSYSRGVYRYDEGKDEFVMFRPLEADLPLGHIMQDRTRDYFWMSDFRGGLYRFDPYGQEVFVRSVSRPACSGENHFENLLDMAQDDQEGLIWGVSRNHLLVFRPEPDGHLTPLEMPMFDGFSGTMMLSLLPTPGAMWVARVDKESSVIYLTDNHVRAYELPNVRRRYGVRPVITDMVPADGNGLYWMVQHRSGLLLYNLKTDDAAYHDELPELKRLRLGNVTEIAQSPSHRGGVWVAPEKRRGIYAITHNNMSMALADSVVFDHILPPSARVTRIYENRRGRVWTGTTAGLYCYDLSSRDFTAMFPELGFITGITEGADRKIYALAKDGGLYEIVGHSARSVGPGGETQQRYTSLAADPDGRIWVGCDDGSVVRFGLDDEEDKQVFTIADPGRRYGVRQIYFSADGHGWIVSDCSLIEFNPATGQHFTYTSDDDIPLFRFLSMNVIPGSGCGGVVGGAGGLVVLRSNPLLDDVRSEAPTVISDIVVGGESRVFNPEGDAFDGHRLVIGPDERNIEIYFTSLDYRYPAKKRFAYRMEGVDDDWQVTEPGENRAFYNSLPRGTHRLEVKYIDEYNRESSTVTELVVERRPHLYETWWAFMAYVILGLGLTGGGLYLYLRRMRERNEEMWTDSEEMVKMRSYLSSPVTLPDEEFQKLDRKLLENATKAVEASIDNPDFDVKALAEAVNMSRSTFARKLKSVTGKTPLDFIREIKIRHACRLLESKNYTIGQVADMVGFRDRRYFTACFRKEIGMSPRDYQNGKAGDGPEEPEG